MNKIFKVIWSKARNCYIVVSELAKNHDTGHTSRIRGGLLAASLMLSLSCPMYGFAADMPNTYTTGGVTYTLSSSSGLTGIYYDEGSNKCATVTYQGNEYNPEKASVILTVDKSGAVDEKGNVVYGEGNTANGHGNVIYGKSNSADVGTQSDAGQAVVMGIGNAAKGKNTTIIGQYNTENAENDVVIGNQNKTKGNSVVMGKNNTVNSPNAVAIGSDIKVNGSSAGGIVIIGNNAMTDSQAGGWTENKNNQQVYHEGGIVLGENSYSNRKAGRTGYVPGSKTGYMPGFVDTNGSLKEYVNVSTNTKIPDLPKGWTAGIEPYWNAVWTATANPLSIGNADDDANEKGELHNGKLVTRQITGVAAGTALTDAVNVAQLEYAIAQFSQGGGGTGGSDIHFYSVNEKSDQRGNYDNKGATGTDALAAGVDAQATGNYSVAVGNGANAPADGAVAIGEGSIATRGKGNKEGTVSIDQTTGKTTITNYGNEKTAYLKPDNLSTDSTTWVSTAGAVSVGGTTEYKEKNDNGKFVTKTNLLTRQITNVAAGSDDTDAVNVAQLKRLNENLSGQHTIVTVGGNSVAKITNSTTGGNLDLTRTTATNGQETYDLSLDRHVTLGEQAENKGGSLTVNNVDAFKNYDEKGNRLDDSIIKEAVKIDGKTVSIVKRDGTDGENDQRQVVLGVGQDTGGYVTLYDSTGKKPTYIYNAISPGITYLKDKDSYSKPDEFGRLEYKISNDPPQFIATLDDGQKYAGDNYLAADIETTDGKTTVKKEEQNVITKKLNERLDIQGGAKDKLTQNNIGVNVVDGVLKVQLAKDIDLTNDGSVTMGNTTINNGGVTITTKDGNKTNTISLTDNGLNNGGKTITNVAEGTNGTDAVNVSQLKASKTTVTSENHSVMIETTNDSPDKHTNYDLKIATASLSQEKSGIGDSAVATGKVTVTNPKISIVEDGETKQIDNLNAYVTGQDVADAINNSGFKLTTSAGAGKVSGTTTELIHPGDTVTIDAGKNIDLTQDKDKITIALSDQVNLHQDGSLSLGGTNSGTASDGEDPIVIRHFDGNTLDLITGTNHGTPITSKEGKAGDYVTGLDNKDWSVDNPTYVSGRAATEDQLKAVTDAMNNATTAAGKHTAITVNDNKNPEEATPGNNAYGEYNSTNGNLMISAKKDDNGQMTYNIKLNENLNLSDNGSVKMGNTTINNNGITILYSAGDTSKNVSLTNAGLDNGGNKITNVAKGESDNDAVNMSQLNQFKTRYYSVNDQYNGHDVTLPDYLKSYSNKDNLGGKKYGSLAAGYVTYADGYASTVAGSFSDVTARSNAPYQGATAVSYGTFNRNESSEKAGTYSGVANSIVGQANMTSDSNASLIYGAGNVITNSYRDIDDSKLGDIVSSQGNPQKLGEALQAAVPQSGGQVMAFGGGNTVDTAYMTQVIGVGNTVKGDQAWTSVAADAKEEDKKAAEESNKNTTQLNYVDGFYTKLTNGKNDYLIGAHNTVTGDSVEKNKSNIVFGDNHTLENQSNNIIIGSANTENTVTKASNAVIIGHNANASVDDGVAIGAESVANMGVPTTAGYDPSGATHKSTDAAWTATKAAVSVGNATKGSNGKFTGTTRQITNVAAGAEDTDAVNVAQLKQLKSVVDSASGKHTLVTVNGGKQAPKDTVPNNDKYSQYTPSSDGNLQLAQKVNDGQITYDLKLSDDLNIGKAGTNGKDGVDGKIGVNGKDGASVVINGKDGSIGLTGPKGADGKDGASLTMRAEKGDPGVNGTDGITRIVYDGQQVATLDDGLKFGGDFGDVSKVKLNKQVNVKGNATNEKDLVDGNIGVVSRQDGENGQLLIKLNKNINLGNDGSITINNVKVNNEGLKITNSTTDDTKNVVINGNTISMGGNKITNVARGEAGTDAVNVSQLTEVKQLASKHTLVTVNGGKQAPEDTVPNNDKYSQYTSSSDGNLQLAQKVNDGQITYDVKLNEKLDLTDKGSVTTGNTVMNNDGVKVDDGNGNSTAVTTGGVTVQDSNGNTTKVEAGKISVGNGTNNVTINGDSGTVNGLTNKTWDGEHYVSGQGATEDQLHQVESNVNKKFDDVNKRIENVDKHHTEVTVNGGTSAPTTENTYSEGNLQIAQKTGANGQKVYDLKLNDNLNIGSVGKAGKDGKDGHIGINGKDGKSSVGIDGKDGISVIGADGKNGVSIIGSNGLNGKDGIDGKIAIGTPGKDGQPGKDAISISGQNGEGHIGLTGAAGKDGKNATADIHVKNGQVGVDGTDGRGGKDGMDRVVYEDHNGTPHEVATMDDGMKYGDDFGNTAKVKLNHQLDIVGDINAGKKDGDKKATKDDLSDGNIGIIATDTTYNKDGTVKENGKMTVKLAKDLKGLNSIESNSVTTGNTTINNGGLTIKTEDANRTITVQDGNVNMGGNQIHNVAPGQAPGDAVNVSQLNATNSAVNKLGNRINRVGAGAAALAALHPLDFDPDDKWDFAAGYGNYRGANAAAIGAYYRPNEDTMFSVGGSFGGGENMVNAGVSIKLGQGNHVSTSRVAMAKEIKDLRQNVANLNAIVNRQSALIDKLTGTNAGTVSDTGNDLFPDVPANHWAYEYVTKLKQAGILTGYPDGNFDGDRMMTRYEFAAIVYRAIMAGAASNPALNQDGTLNKLAKEFSPEMKYIRIDTIAKDKNDKPTIERVRVIPDAK